MRLWHYKLIPVLPRQQLLGQWRECCLIAKEIKEKGNPHHILVNKVLSNSGDFLCYCMMVEREMKSRGYKVGDKASTKLYKDIVDCNIVYYDNIIANLTPFPDWHNVRYLRQCYYNLQEKYDCGAISEEEWNKILEQVKVFIDARFMDV